MQNEARGLVLDIEGLKTYFALENGIAKAVDDVSLTIRSGATLGVVGESGCGKSMTALSIMRLVPKPGKIAGGKIIFDGTTNLTDLSEKQMRQIRGNRISMIFQEPMTSLNPVMQIGKQIVEAVKYHQQMTNKDAMDRALEMLKLVGISSPERKLRDYPHQLSGGMRQRVMIGMALSCNPKLMLADEPTTALDVTIQAQILDLMNRLKEDVGTAIMLITHDLGVIAEMAQDVCVMYAGVLVESASVKEIFTNPLHPYTEGLLQSVPHMDRDADLKAPLNTIAGIVPNLLDLVKGCKFSDRCLRAREICKSDEPPIVEIGQSHFVRCWEQAK
jgi:peptide/nickel transport system ATP-binding protein/oligopeptide transport system ATP-binding protein